MSDYSKITDFAAKDALLSGDPAKVVTGTAHDNEYNAIAVAVATKYDSTDLASQVQAEAGANNTTLMTPLRVAQAITALAVGGATYDPAAVAITGGTVNGTIIGGTVPQAVTGTTVTGTTVNANTTLQIGGVAVTATAAEINKLAGTPAGLTSTELGYVDGVTSAIQTQLNTKAPSASPTFTGTATFSGATITNLGTVTTADINGGSIDGTAIGAASHSTGKFTTLQATGACTLGAEVIETVYTVSGTNPALDPANGTIQSWALGASQTPTSNLATGESITMRISRSGSYTITWPTMTWIGGTAVTIPASGYAWVVLFNVAGTLYGVHTGDTTS